MTVYSTYYTTFTDEDISVLKQRRTEFIHIRENLSKLLPTFSNKSDQIAIKRLIKLYLKFEKSITIAISFILGEVTFKQFPSELEIFIKHELRTVKHP